MKNWKKKFMAFYVFALITVPVVSNVAPKDTADPEISTCGIAPGSPWVDGTVFDDDIETYP